MSFIMKCIKWYISERKCLLKKKALLCKRKTLLIANQTERKSAVFSPKLFNGCN